MHIYIYIDRQIHTYIYTTFRYDAMLSEDAKLAFGGSSIRTFRDSSFSCIKLNESKMSVISSKLFNVYLVTTSCSLPMSSHFTKITLSYMCISLSISSKTVIWLFFCCSCSFTLSKATQAVQFLFQFCLVWLKNYLMLSCLQL